MLSKIAYFVKEISEKFCDKVVFLISFIVFHFKFQLKKQLVKRLYNTKMPSKIQITSRKSRLSVPPQPKVPKLDTLSTNRIDTELQQDIRMDTELISSQPTEDDEDSIDNDNPISTDSGIS